jgi:PAS domain S-box-containing protein
MMYPRVAAASALVPLAFGLLGLAGWKTGRLRLASLDTTFIPMAPSTAAVCLVVSAALIAVAFWHGTAMRNAVRAAACLVATLAFIELVEFFADVTVLKWEEVFILSTGTFGAVPLAHMSPLTAATFELVGPAVWCLTSIRAAVRDLGGVLGSLALLMGSTVVLGYAYGAPVLYGGLTIPMALTTGLAFMGTGIALVALAGPTSLPLRPFSGGVVRASLAETERKRAEKALRNYEILTGSLVEHLPQSVFVKDVNSIYVFCNSVYARDLGIERTQIVGKDDFALFSRELAEAYRADDRQVMTDGKSKARDERYVVAGEERWVHTVKVPYRDERGAIIGVLGLFEDISERKRVEAQREQLAALVEASPDCVGVADPKTTQIKYLNRGGRKMCGIGEDEDILKLKISDLHSARMNQRMAEVVLPAALRDGLWEGDGALLHRDGREIPVSIALLAHRGADGEVDFFYAVSRDITKWNQAVAALRTAEERMRFALEAAGIGIWDMDYTTGVLRWSETLEAHYGLQPGTFSGTFEAFVERIHPDDRASVLETVGKAMKAGTDFSVQNRSIWRDGTVRWLSGAGRVLLGQHGEPVRGVGISMDVTERRTLEAQFQQAQKMEAVGRLAGGVAHDFNNLLTVILGFCELLLADRDPDDPRQADIAEIQKAGTRAAGLTRQLLAFSRKQIIEPTLLNLNVVVADMRSMLERLIGEDVKVVLGLGPELASVKADRGEVEQIVMNLAVNARDAMPKGGTLTIETANVELDEHYAETHLAVKPGAYVALTVTDTGTGMTPEVQSRLFEPFFTTKEVGKGTGLGMATVYGIVTASGGSVGVYSEVGKGTSFKVYFPPAQAAEGLVVARPPVNRRRAEGETVLLVEDADGVRELTRRLLQRLGYTVLVAANADEALRLFEQHPSIDLLLTDVVMPGASGPELTKRLVEERRALRVIYMSGYTEEAIVQHGVLKPGIAFLHKPFTSETLGAKIREVLER